MEYPKIETLFDRDEKTHKVYPDKLRNPVFGLIKTWQFTEKIDGTNIRCIWSGDTFSFAGRTEKASLPAKLIQWLLRNLSNEVAQEVFGNSPAILYGEGYGAGIQKGGGAYNREQQFVLFDVLVEDKWWLNWENTRDVARKFGLRTVPYIGEMSLEDGVQMVRLGFDSILAKEITGETVKAEGIVGRTSEPLFDKKGNRLIIKLKTRDF